MPKLPLHLVCVIGTLLILAIAPSAAVAEQGPTRPSLQMIVVTTPGWDAIDGSLQRFERTGPGKPWKPVGDPIAIVVGRKGMGWGAGILPTDAAGIRGATDPVKKEGDGKSPAGVFRIGPAFGDADQAPATWKMSYIRLTPTVECVDDTASRSYNQIVDRTQLSPDWNSSEHMASVGEAYRWGAVIDQNMNPIVPGGGSCVFLHIWNGPGSGTAGCTAMPQQQLEPILAWLNPAAHPILVQLPIASYNQLKPLWHLPALSR